MYCKKCGGKIESYASHCPFCGEALATNSVQATYTSNAGQELGAHKGIGGWILTYIIMAIPVIGLIAILVWAFGEETKKDPTFRNWARAQILVSVLAVVAIVLLAILVVALGLNFPEV